MEHTVMQ